MPIECCAHVGDAPMLKYTLPALILFDELLPRNYVGPTLLKYGTVKLIHQIAVALQFPRHSPEAAGRQRLQLFISVDFKSSVSECD